MTTTIKKAKDFPVNYLTEKSKETTVFRIALCPLVTTVGITITEKGIDCKLCFDQEWHNEIRGAISLEYFRDTDFHIPFVRDQNDSTPSASLVRTNDHEATITVFN